MPLPRLHHRDMRHHEITAMFANHISHTIAVTQCGNPRSASGNSMTYSAASHSVTNMLPRPCPCCGGRMFIIETFARGREPKHRPTPAPAAIRIDTS
jgi:hypothetical protein